jgi:hypothetical protein
MQSPALPFKTLDMSVNKLYLVVVITAYNLPGLIVGYVLSYSNPLTPLLNAKFGWETEAAKN